MKTATERFTELSASIKEKEKRLAEIQVLKKHIFDYFKIVDYCNCRDVARLKRVEMGTLKPRRECSRFKFYGRNNK